MLSTRYVFATLAVLAFPAGAQAQRVSADISIGGGPVAGRIIVGDPYYHHPSYHYRPVYREVVVVRGHRGHGWYRNRGYPTVRVYYDVDRDRYYDRPYCGGLRAMVVFQGDGRYYRDDDRRDGYWRDDYRQGDYRNDYRRRAADRSDRWQDDDDRD
jgi:hypothetical protein